MGFNRFIGVIFLFLLGGYLFAQVRPGDTLKFEVVYDSAYGIRIYEPLNMITSGDSVRSDAKGYAVQGWIQDYYRNGQVLHKGFYIDGQLKVYKNFFPDGSVEREFRMTDLSKSTLTIYYHDKKIRSNIIFLNKSTLKEEDYFPSGQLEYIEEYDRRIEYYIQRKFFSESGKPTSTLELVDNKKKVYSCKEYYDNGNLKEEGSMIYNKNLSDYQKDGKWKFYNEDGSVKEEKIFAKGDESND